MLLGCNLPWIAEAQIGCWENVGGMPTCVRLTLSCETDGNCASGSCIDNVCVDAARRPCTPCLGGMTCPGEFDGGSLSPASTVRRCIYNHPCGVERQIQPVGLASTSLCFLAADRVTPVLWGAGDCDGDGLVNGMESDSACVDVVVREAPMTAASTATHVVERAFETCSAGTREVAPGRCASLDVLGVACRSGACGEGARCVRTTPSDGICTYSAVPAPFDRRTREDGSCVEAALTNGWPTSSLALACSVGVGGWPQGDCDRDGIPNHADAHVCEQLALVRRAASGLFFQSSPGQVTTCGSGGRSVLPSDMACADATDSVSFGVACDMHQDCPVVPGNFGRCLFLPTVTDSVLGVCLYDPVVEGDDNSCLSHPPTGCFNTGGDYDFVAIDNCDGTSPMNAADRDVCSVSVVPTTDAGVDAGPDGGLDAGPDAPALDASAQEDARGGRDASGPPVTFSGGGGCVCAAGSHAPLGSVGFTVLALIAGALGRMRRKVSRVNP